MQVTTLNKIINLFLIGTFVVVVVAAGVIVQFRDVDSEKYKSLPVLLGSPVIVFVVTLFLVSTIILLGIVVDTLANISVRPLVKIATRKKWAALILGSGKDVVQHEYLMGKFKQRFTKCEKYCDLFDDERYYKAYAVAFFFHSANKETIEWVVQHYSIYLLSTSYLFILYCTPFLIMMTPVSTGAKACLFFANILFIYTLIYQSIHKYLYSYDVVFRHGAVVLSSEKSKELSGVEEIKEAVPSAAPNKTFEPTAVN